MKPFVYLTFLIALMFNHNLLKAQCDEPKVSAIIVNSEFEAIWDSTVNEAAYEVAISTDSTHPQRGIYTTSHSYSFPAKPDTRYCVFVRKRCKDNTFSPMAMYCTTTPCEAPIQVNLDFSRGDNIDVKASWFNSQIKPPYYEYALTTDSSTPSTGSTTTDTSLNLRYLQPNKQYCFHLRFFCPKSQVYSPWQTMCFTTPGTTGIGNIGSIGKMLISPNPAREQVNVSLPDMHSSHSLIITDMAGRIVSRSETSNSIATLDVSRLGGGIYFIRISGKEYNTTEKLVIGE